MGADHSLLVRGRRSPLGGCLADRKTGQRDIADAFFFGIEAALSDCDLHVFDVRILSLEVRVQDRRVRRFILEGVDFIIIAPTVEEGWDTILQEIRDAKIPVIIVDRSVAVDDDNLFLTNIGSDFLRQGNLAVEWLEGEIPADKTAKILHLQGTIGATAQILRTKALEDAAAKHSNWEITSQLYGDFTEAKAYEVMTEYLKTNKEIDVLYSENDNMTFGAMRALDEAGISYGNGGQVKIITFDATKEALQYCHDGKINLCVECNPMFGPQIKQLIEKYRNGEEIPKHVYVDESAYTTQNITQDFVDSRAY